MDPNATVDRIVDALREGDLEEAFWAINDLNGWLSKGGFLPDRPRLLRLLKGFETHVAAEGGEEIKGRG